MRWFQRGALKIAKFGWMDGWMGRKVGRYLTLMVDKCVKPSFLAVKYV